MSDTTTTKPGAIQAVVLELPALSASQPHFRLALNGGRLLDFHYDDSRRCPVCRLTLAEYRSLKEGIWTQHTTQRVPGVLRVDVECENDDDASARRRSSREIERMKRHAAFMAKAAAAKAREEGGLEEAKRLQEEANRTALAVGLVDEEGNPAPERGVQTTTRGPADAMHARRRRQRESPRLPEPGSMRATRMSDTLERRRRLQRAAVAQAKHEVPAAGEAEVVPASIQAKVTPEPPAAESPPPEESEPAAAPAPKKRGRPAKKKAAAAGGRGRRLKRSTSRED